MLKENDDIVSTVVGRVMRYIQTYMEKEVDLSAKFKRKKKVKIDDIWKPQQEMKCKKLLIDLKVEVGGTITNASQ
jgi:hypothetical protein